MSDSEENFNKPHRHSLPAQGARSQRSHLRTTQSQRDVSKGGIKKQKIIAIIPPIAENDAELDASNKDDEQGNMKISRNINSENELRMSKMSNSSKSSKRKSLYSSGHVNEGFDSGSQNNINLSARSSRNPSIATVQKEQYCCWSNWGTCQKAAAATISVLVIIIIVLIIVVIILSQKDNNPLTKLSLNF